MPQNPSIESASYSEQANKFACDNPSSIAEEVGLLQVIQLFFQRFTLPSSSVASTFDQDDFNFMIIEQISKILRSRQTLWTDNPTDKCKEVCKYSGENLLNKTCSNDCANVTSITLGVNDHVFLSQFLRLLGVVLDNYTPSLRQSDGKQSLSNVLDALSDITVEIKSKLNTDDICVPEISSSASTTEFQCIFDKSRSSINVVCHHTYNQQTMQLEAKCSSNSKQNRLSALKNDYPYIMQKALKSVVTEYTPNIIDDLFFRINTTIIADSLSENMYIYCVVKCSEKFVNDNPTTKCRNLCSASTDYNKQVAKYIATTVVSLSKEAEKLNLVKLDSAVFLTHEPAVNYTLETLKEAFRTKSDAVITTFQSQLLDCQVEKQLAEDVDKSNFAIDPGKPEYPGREKRDADRQATHKEQNKNTISLLNKNSEERGVQIARENQDYDIRSSVTEGAVIGLKCAIVGVFGYCLIEFGKLVSNKYLKSLNRK